MIWVPTRKSVSTNVIFSECYVHVHTFDSDHAQHDDIEYVRYIIYILIVIAYWVFEYWIFIFILLRIIMIIILNHIRIYKYINIIHIYFHILK